MIHEENQQWITTRGLYRVLNVIIPGGLNHARQRTHPVDRAVMPITDRSSDRYRYRGMERQNRRNGAYHDRCPSKRRFRQSCTFKRSRMHYLLNKRQATRFTYIRKRLCFSVSLQEGLLQKETFVWSHVCMKTEHSELLFLFYIILFLFIIILL